ncbi:MAG: 30S ribosomal protein S16 [Flavobacteriaceae bacterium]|nr:30S ribosomal protein S16 [Flavobacteriaceae bacterium]
MPVKIRLQRHGKKGKPFFWVVAADSRSKRDGRMLEKIGTYNPVSNPATIELDVDAASKMVAKWCTTNRYRSGNFIDKGALLKNHLLIGVNKGALTPEQAEVKFNAWVTEKENKIESKKSGLVKAKEDAAKKALEAEKEVNAKRKAAVEDAENERIKAEADAKAAEAAAKAPKVEEAAPLTIDDVVEQAKNENN